MVACEVRIFTMKLHHINCIIVLTESDIRCYSMFIAVKDGIFTM